MSKLDGLSQRASSSRSDYISMLAIREPIQSGLREHRLTAGVEKEFCFIGGLRGVGDGEGVVRPAWRFLTSKLVFRETYSDLNKQQCRSVGRSVGFSF